MKKKNWFYRIFSLALVTVTLSAFVALAAEVGSANDPLVTLSYLNETFQQQIMARVENIFNQRDAQLKQQLNDQVWQAEQKLASQYGGSTQGDSASTYAVVTLKRDQCLYGTVGTEVMLRVGTAVCLANSNPGLIDSTNGETLADARGLKTNRLYLMTVEGRGVQATADTVKLLVRGSYEIK